MDMVTKRESRKQTKKKVKIQVRQTVNWIRDTIIVNGQPLCILFPEAE